jgi:hypothetical protein
MRISGIEKVPDPEVPLPVRSLHAGTIPCYTAIDLELL